MAVSFCRRLFFCLPPERQPEATPSVFSAFLFSTPLPTPPLPTPPLPVPPFPTPPPPPPPPPPLPLLSNNGLVNEVVSQLLLSLDETDASEIADERRCMEDGDVEDAALASAAEGAMEMPPSSEEEAASFDGPKGNFDLSSLSLLFDSSEGRSMEAERPGAKCERFP